MEDTEPSPLARRLRVARGITTQTGLAKAVGVPQGSISRWENAACVPSLDVLTRIAMATHVSLAWLVTGEGEMHAAPPCS